MSFIWSVVQLHFSNSKLFVLVLSLNINRNALSCIASNVFFVHVYSAKMPYYWTIIKI